MPMNEDRGIAEEVQVALIDLPLDFNLPIEKCKLFSCDSIEKEGLDRG